MSRFHILLPAFFLTAGIAFGVFFTGGRDIMYAPALFCITIAALLCALPALKTGLSLPGRTPAALLFLFWLYATLSQAWSNVPFISLVTWLMISALPLTFFALLSSPARTDIIRTTLAGFIAIACGLALWALYEITLTAKVRATGPFDDPNNLAALFNLALLPAAAIFFTRTERDKITFAAGLACLAIFAGLVTTQSRGGFISLLLAMPLFFAIVPVKKERVVSSLLAAIVIFTGLQFLSSDPLALRLWNLIAPASDGPAMARIALWGSAWQMVKDNPLTGMGLGTFYLFYPPYRMPIVDDLSGMWVHMDPLQFAVEMGVLAPILLYALAVSIAVRTRRAMIQGSNPHARALTGGSVAALFALLLQAHGNFPLYALPILIACGIVMAAWYDGSAQLTDKPSYETAEFSKPWQKPFFSLCLFFTAFLFSATAASTAAGQYYMSQASQQISRNDLPGFIASIEKAQKSAPRSFGDPQVQTAGLYIDMMGVPEPLLSADDHKKMFEDALDLLAQAEALNPAMAEINFKRGKLYSMARAEEEQAGKFKADEEWRRAIMKDPMHYRARIALAQSLFGKGRVGDAFDLLAIGLTYPAPAAVSAQISSYMAQIRPYVTIQQNALKEKAPKKK